MQNLLTVSDLSGPAWARFMRTLSSAALDLAHDLETAGDGRRRALDDVELGTLQRPVAEVAGMNTDGGISPREICRHIGREDEPNIRTALQALQKKGIAELVPGEPKQRWRLTAPYRTT
jgi:hypothetical protein